MVSPESSVDEDRYLETFDELSQSLTYTRSKLNSVDSRSGLWVFIFQFFQNNSHIDKQYIHIYYLFAD